MPITQGMAYSFKVELLEAKHNFLASGGHVFNMALYTSAATHGPASATYSATNEVANGNGYATGGKGLANVNPSLDTATGITDFADLTWAASTITANGAGIYNTNAGANRAVVWLSFGGDKSSSAGDFTIVFPVPAAATAIIRIA